MAAKAKAKSMQRPIGADPKVDDSDTSKRRRWERYADNLLWSFRGRLVSVTASLSSAFYNQTAYAREDLAPHLFCILRLTI